MDATVDNLTNNDVAALLQEVMTDPVMVAETGHTYERAAILRWLLTNRSYLTRSIHSIVLESQLPHKTVNLLVPITTSKRYVDVFVGELTLKNH